MRWTSAQVLSPLVKRAACGYGRLTNFKDSSSNVVAFDTARSQSGISLAQADSMGAAGESGLSKAGPPIVYHPAYSAPQLAPGHRFPMQVRNSSMLGVMRGPNPNHSVELISSICVPYVVIERNPQLPL